MGFTLTTHGAFAQAQRTSPTPIQISSDFSQRELGLDIAIFEDTSTTRAFEEVRNTAVAQQFVPSAKVINNFGYTQSAYWARFSLKQSVTNTLDAREPLFLTLTYAPTDLVQLYCTDASGTLVVQQKAGDHVPREQWPTSYREPVFKITHQAETCWLRLQTSTSMQMPLTLYSQTAFMRMYLMDTALQALYFGAILMMIIYNGINAFLTRSKAYTSYVVFLIAFSLFQCAFGGLGYAYLWPFAANYVDYAIPLVSPIAGMSSMYFTATLLDLRLAAPRWYLVFKVVFIGFILSVLSLFFVQPSSSLLFTSFLSFVWGVSIIGSGISLARRGHRVAKIFLVAWLGLIAGVVIVALGSLGLLALNGFTINAAQIGSALEMVALNSLALANRFYKIRLEREAAQQKLLDAQHALVQVLQTKEEELYRRVLLRTAEIRATNERIIIAFDLAIEAKDRAYAEHQEALIARRQADEALTNQQIALQQLKVANDQLQLMAITDGLTKVNNRAFFDKTFMEEYRRSQRMKIPLSLIILDIDFFKKINDTYGHPGGDACLRAMANLIQSKITRAGDIVARFGGEEFVILLPDCNLDNAVKFAESLREHVQQLQVQFEELAISFTASFGVACGLPDVPFNTELLLSQADTALYQGKRDGRNCVKTLADCMGSLPNTN